MEHKAREREAHRAKGQREKDRERPAERELETNRHCGRVVAGS